MELLTLALNVTLDGCCDDREMIANDKMHRYWARVMDSAGAMLFGRRTYELMEDAWPQVARDPKATPSNRDLGSIVQTRVGRPGAESKDPEKFRRARREFAKCTLGLRRRPS